MPKKRKVPITDEWSDYMHDTIVNIVNHAGPRAPASPAERKAAEWVAKELEKSCDSVEIEEFTTYPKAFLGWIRLDLGLILISFLIFLIRPLQPLIISIICLALGLFAVLILWEQFLCYKEWTPKFFPYKKATSQNVVGTIKPASSEIEKRVVFAGHLDSAFRFNLIHYTWQGYAYFLFLVIISLIAFIITYLMAFIYAIIPFDSTILTNILTWVIILIPIMVAIFFLGVGKSDKFFFGAFARIKRHTIVMCLAITAYTIIIDILLYNYAFIDPTINKTMIVLMINSLPPLFAFLFFASNKATPGVTDNLTAVVTSMCVAKVLKEWKDTNHEYFPKNTEVVIAIVGCEENGLRGSEAFAKKHASEYNKIDTTVVNMESLTQSRYQVIFKRENTTRTDLSPEVYNLLSECCKELRIMSGLIDMPGIAGGTDSAGFVRGGLKSACLVGLIFKDFLSYYHTDRDNLSLLNKERRPWNECGDNYSNRNIRGAMEMALQICLKYLEKKDIE
jgi:hypothetical protein